MMIINVNDKSFEQEVLKSDLPVLVDFWAPWCGPCRQLDRTVHETAMAYDGRLKVAKLNCDANPDTMTRYNVRSIPTLILFNKGLYKATNVGRISASDLEQFIDTHV